MNVTPKKSYFRQKFLALIVAALLLAAFVLVGVQAATLRSNSPDPFTPYDPATYGIPYEIGGFRILAVKTSENTGCVGSGMMTVRIQSPHPDVQSAMANSGDVRVVYETLQQIPSLEGIKFTLEVGGPVPWNPEQFMSRIAEWNEATKDGCLQLGPAPPLPTPDPFTPYDPLTFGIPEIVAGYRIVAVHTLENTACMPVDYIRVTIQAVEPSADNPMVPVDGGDIIFELKKIKPDVQWQLEYIMPGPVDRSQFVTSMAQWNEVMKNGCHQLGGPAIIASLTPDPFAPYDPLTFGIPEIVAGYRIVAVHSSDNTPCTPPDTLRLIIQAVDPSPDNPMVAVDGGDVVFEVKKLHPDIEVSLQYVMPVPFNRSQFVASMADWNEMGCVILGGPAPTVTPEV